jgi:hypothetical protein
MADGGADLSGFLEAAGRSLADAQRQLVGSDAGADGTPTMAISEVEIDVKATLEGEAGQVQLQPISSSDARAGAIQPELLSSLRVRFVALPDFGAGTPPVQPGRNLEDAIGEARKRDDVRGLEEALGDLEFDATFVPETGSWLVRVMDSEGRVMRDVVIPDAE